MLKSYLHIAWRNLQKNKIYSLINISGLSVGLAVFWLMSMYIRDELSFDRDSVNADRIYRVVQTGSYSGGNFKLAITPPPLGPALQKDFPGIEAMARVDAEGNGTMIYGDKKLEVPDMIFADSTLLTVFRFPFLAGDPVHALGMPHSIVLTRTVAKKMFGSVDAALDKTVTIEHDGPALVTGVIEDRPENTHLRFGALRTLPSPETGGWMNSYLYTYVLLRAHADVRKIETGLPEFFDRYLKAPMGKGAQYRMFFQPVASIHLHSSLDFEIGHNGDIRYIWLFSAIALLILGIAVINYINLATARSSVRLKEIGVRKVIGSDRKQLMIMFLTESVLFAVLAAIVASFLTYALLPVFNTLSGKQLSINMYRTGPAAFVLLGSSILIGLGGGLYPALFLSGFRTIPSLKGQQGNQSATILFRKSLVTFQFVTTVFLIAGSAIIWLQLHYMQTRDIGLNKDQVLIFHLPNPEVRQHIEDLKTQLLQDPSVEAVAAAGNPIGDNFIGSIAVRFEQNNGAFSGETKLVQSFYVDADYLPTLQIGLKAGRNFSAALPTDQFGSVLVNETFASEMGWNNPVGKRIRLAGGPDGTLGMATVIGLMKDFNIYSLQHKIQPLILRMPPVLNEEDNVYVRVNPARVARALEYIKEVCHRFDPASAPACQFIDEKFANQYVSERKQGSLLLTFTLLAIMIAGLGLFGLVTFSIGQRTKEIGIRKVLGASVSGIVMLLSKDLVKPVGIAILIATPLTAYMMHRWLQEFAYRISIHAWIFLAAGGLALLIAMLTVGGKAALAARANPVKSLHAE